MPIHLMERTTSASSSSGASTCPLMERTTSRLASEYARTSEELVGYASFLESALEHAQALDARNQSALAAHRLTLAHRQAHTLAADKAQALETARHCREQLCFTQALLADEQIRAKPELSATRSFKDERTNWSSAEVDEGRCSSRREQRKGCSPIRSILKESREFCTKESQPGRDIHDAAAQKKCPLTKFQVPPLDIPSNKSTRTEIPSSLYRKCASGLHAYSNEQCGDDGELSMDDNEQLPRGKKQKHQKQKQEQEQARDVTPQENHDQVFNKRQAERGEIAKCQTDIMKMLHGLKANVGYLLDLEERSQFRHPYPN